MLDEKFEKRLLRLICICGWLSILGFIQLPLHEWFHWIVARALGGESCVYMSIRGLTVSVWVESAKLPGNSLWVAAFAGGFGVFVVYMGIWILARKYRLISLGFNSLTYAIGSLLYACAELVSIVTTNPFYWLIERPVLLSSPPVLLYFFVGGLIAFILYRGELCRADLPRKKQWIRPKTQ